MSDTDNETASLIRSLFQSDTTETDVEQEENPDQQTADPTRGNIARNEGRTATPAPTSDREFLNNLFDRGW